MAEQIGNVILDDTFYPGEDLYCDGEIEDTLLSIVQNHSESEYPRIIEERGSWPILYHLSHLRENIVNWLPITKQCKVLEVGSGCGAITGALAERAGSVTCVDLSKKRSLINAYRHKDCDNITIKMGNFKDIEPTLDTDYDYVFLIGVFEYGQGYMGTDTPYQDFMRIIRRHCAQNGRLVIAIENQYGLKYFAGCREDHVGAYFAGLEGYPAGGGVRTFSRRGLERICEQCGITDYHFYYPYPDYKFMTTIYSDEYLPRVGELTNNLRNFDRERMLLFDEKNVYDGLIRDGRFPEFSNSFLLVIGSEPEQIYSKFSNDRAQQFAIRTDICKAEQYYVEKHADLPQAQEHIQNLLRQDRLLEEKYAGSGLKINCCEAVGSGIRFDFVQGETLEAVLDNCIYQNDRDGFIQNLTRYQEIAAYHEEMPVSDYDLIFSNILVGESEEPQRAVWTLIDYEWTVEETITAQTLIQRAMFVYILGPDMRRKWLFANGIAQECGVTPDNLESLQQQELTFQHRVTAGRKSMYELYQQMGQPAYPVQESLRKVAEQEMRQRLQVYEDTGDGFSEEKSYFIRQEQEHIDVTVSVADAVRQIRLDPGTESCMLREVQLVVNGHAVDAGTYACNGYQMGENAWLFATQDPNLTIDLNRLQQAGIVLQRENEISLRAQRQPLSMTDARYLEQLLRSKEKKPFWKR